LTDDLSHVLAAVDFGEGDGAFIHPKAVDLGEAGVDFSERRE
jgi:hypothetical protein